MEEILPPMPPEAKTTSKKYDLPEFELGNTKRKSFFSKILRKEEPVPQRPIQPTSESITTKEDTNQVEPKNVPKADTTTDTPEVSKDDLNNIRKALGIKEETQPSIREKFEQKAFDETKPEEDEDDDIKPPTPVKRKTIEPKKQEKETKKQVNEKKPKVTKITPPDLTDLILKHNKQTPIKKPVIKVNPEKPLEKLDKDFEKNKNQLVKKVENKDATVSHAKHQAKKHFDNYKKQIDKLTKTHTIQINKEKKAHETKLKIQAEKLEKKRLTLNDKELKLKEWEVKLSEKEKKLNEQISELEEYSKEIAILDKQLTKNKEDIEKQKTTLLDLKSQINISKKALAESNQMQKDVEKAHEESLRKIDEELKKKKKEYDEIERKSFNEKKILDAKRAEIKKEQQRLEKLIDDEKRVSEALKSRESIDKDKRISVIEDQPTHHEEWQKDYQEKYVAVQESSQDSIHKKMQDCRELLTEQKYDDAKYIYNDIRSEFISANINNDEKASLKKEIKELYDEICLTILNKA